MKASKLSRNEFELELTVEECLVIANCITEACNEMDADEFDTRVAGSRDDALKLRDILRSVQK